MLLCQNLDAHYLKEQNLIMGSWDSLKFLFAQLTGSINGIFFFFQKNTESCQGIDRPSHRLHFPLMVQQMLNPVFYFICAQFGVKLSPFHKMTPASTFVIATRGRRKNEKELGYCF